MPLFFKLRNIICFFVLFATLPLFVQGQEISSSTMLKTVVIDAEPDEISFGKQD